MERATERIPVLWPQGPFVASRIVVVKLMGDCYPGMSGTASGQVMVVNPDFSPGVTFHWIPKDPALTVEVWPQLLGGYCFKRQAVGGQHNPFYCLKAGGRYYALGPYSTGQVATLTGDINAGASGSATVFTGQSQSTVTVHNLMQGAGKLLNNDTVFISWQHTTPFSGQWVVTARKCPTT